MSSKFFVSLAVSFVFAVLAHAQPGVAPTPHLKPEQEKAKIKLPPGFELQLVAAEPDIRKPMNICFDDKGRLWITETEEYPYAAPAGRKPKDAVKILEDFGPDGRARKITTFADELNIPIGILPTKDGAIVYSIPNIWKLTDTNGDGTCDKLEVLFGPFGTRDTHGMTNSFTMGFDGWIYACHGYLNDTEIKGKDGHVVKMNSGNTYRFKPDGSRVEIYTRGQVNPFGMTWDPYGNLYTADCHSRPITQLIRGAMYESFAKPHDGLGFAPHMNDFKDHSTALCGIVYYAADHFPKEYHDHLFLGDVMHNRVNSYKVEYTGSSPRAIREDFLTSDDPWFRPVDLKLGPDGALYIADFYNKIIGHYEVPLTHPERDRTSGRIWRVVRKDKAPVAPIADYGKATDAELVKALGHPNLTAAMYAMHELAGRGPKVAETVAHSSFSGDDRSVNIGLALRDWVLHRIGDKKLDGNWTKAFADGSDLLRVHLLRMLHERVGKKDWQSLLVRTIAETGDMNPMVQRVAAESLAGQTTFEALKPLVQRGATLPIEDNHSAYAFRLAVRSHIPKFLESWAVLRAFSTPRERQFVLDLLPSVPGPKSAEFVLEIVRENQWSLQDQSRWIQFISRHGMDDTRTDAISFSRKGTKPQEQIGLLLAFHRGLQEAGKPPTKELLSWAEEVKAATLDSDDAAAIRSGAELAGALRITSATPRLIAIAADRKRDVPTRVSVLTALVAIDAAKHTGVCAGVLNDAAEPLPLREQTARVLSGMNSKESRAALIAALTAAPATLATVVAESLAGSREGGEALLMAIEAGKASPRLLQEPPVRVRLQQSRLPNLDARIAKLTAGIPPADQRMNELFQRRMRMFRTANLSPDIGAKVFEKNCAICHQLGGKGAKVGPQLDGIGKRGIERLMEDLLDPNRNIDPAFRTTRITLKNGRDVSGLFLREEGEVTILADNQGKEVRVPRAQIDEKIVLPLSPMPANLVDQIPEGDFLHLIQFLLKQTADAGKQ
jgi:putative heme-binding domain-containing protein